MKKLQIATNGHPRTNNDLIHLQDAILEIGSALGRLCSDDAGTTTPVIIGGLKFTSLGGGLFTIGDGWVFYNNEVFYFAGNPPNIDPPDYLRISSTYAANNPYLGKNIHNIRTMVPIYGSPISGDIPYGFVHAANNIAKKSIGAWQSVYSQGSGIYPRMANGAVGNSGNPVQYRKNGDGSVEMKGQVMLPAGNSGSILALEFGGNLTINFGQVQVGHATLHKNGGGIEIVPVRVYTDGVTMQLSSSYTTVSGDWLYIAPLRFYQTS